ncbi:MAG: pyridoxal-phosphate dependent enzyme [Acidobacteriota bacterium]|nr:pyridoxal-phosphate dependent enzyme [Acidobacteriota bacterium]
MVTASDIQAAYGRIRGDIVHTPMEYSPALSRLTGARVFIKWESDQITGSFKFRGALNKMRTIPADRKKAGVIAASTGNHGLGVARAAGLEGTAAVLYLPKTAVPLKAARLREAGAVVERHGESCENAEAAARRAAGREGKIYISPYNDAEVIAGQGTIGLEILADCPEVDDVFVPVGGGGLIAGLGIFVKSAKPEIRVIGVEPAASAFMKASLRAGRLVAIREGRTAADAVAGGIEPGSITYPLCRAWIDEIRTTGETFLKEALRLCFRHHGRIVEGAGALALAALLKAGRSLRNRTVVLTASGGNIDPARWREITGLDPGTDGGRRRQDRRPMPGPGGRPDRPMRPGGGRFRGRG